MHKYLKYVLLWTSKHLCRRTKCWLYYTPCRFQGENGFCQYFLLASVFSLERQNTFQRRLSSTSVKLLLSYKFATTNLFRLDIKTKNLSRYIFIFGSYEYLSWSLSVKVGALSIELLLSRTIDFHNIVYQYILLWAWLFHPSGGQPQYNFN